LKHTEIFNRLTGISCPLFGVSWNPPESQRKIAQKIIIFLEAKRVLYSSALHMNMKPYIQLLAPYVERHIDTDSNGKLKI